jgi:hypothetical protein
MGYFDSGVGCEPDMPFARLNRSWGAISASFAGAFELALFASTTFAPSLR